MIKTPFFLFCSTSDASLILWQLDCLQYWEKLSSFLLFFSSCNTFDPLQSIYFILYVNIRNSSVLKGSWGVGERLSA